MENRMFSNSSMLVWLDYFSKNTEIDLEKVKIIDITRKNKNLIPTIESHKTVMVFCEAGNQDIFYKMWDVGLGECECIYNEGSEPEGPIFRKPVKEMIDRGINSSAAMIIVNPNARNTYKVGMSNMNFSRGSVQYVGSEIRAVILNKMHMSQNDNVCTINSESIAVEAAIIASEGSVIAVEYNKNDRRTMEENMNQFGLNNIYVIDHVDDKTMEGLPIPSLTMLVASASMEQEIQCMLRLNPEMEFVIYTLDFPCAASIPAMFEKYGIGETEVIQIAVSKLNHKNSFQTEPAPWLITGKAMGNN